MNKVGIIGCGKIFPRHIEAIEQNANYRLVGACDTDEKVLNDIASKHQVKTFKDYRVMLADSDMNFVVVSSPNSLHFEQALYALNSGCNVLIEKPATLNPQHLRLLRSAADTNKQKVYTVLQVRLNSCIQNLKSVIEAGLLGEIRGLGLIQRWQRPKEYFYDWRGNPFIGGGILHECGIHYLDILCHVFGKPKVSAAKKYNTKHKGIKIEDTVYSILDFGNYGATVEVTISSEPRNIECSLSVLSENGFIKLGGKAMNVIEEARFVSEEVAKSVMKVFEGNSQIGIPNSYGSYAGSCPNHPELYRKIDKFELSETSMVLELIDSIYAKCGVRYY